MRLSQIYAFCLFSAQVLYFAGPEGRKAPPYWGAAQVPYCACCVLYSTKVILHAKLLQVFAHKLLGEVEGRAQFGLVLAAALRRLRSPAALAAQAFTNDAGDFASGEATLR